MGEFEECAIHLHSLPALKRGLRLWKARDCLRLRGRDAATISLAMRKLFSTKIPGTRRQNQHSSTTRTPPSGIVH
jgi:hypothetical protein